VPMPLFAGMLAWDGPTGSHAGSLGLPRSEKLPADAGGAACRHAGSIGRTRLWAPSTYPFRVYGPVLGRSFCCKLVG